MGWIGREAWNEWGVPVIKSQLGKRTLDRFTLLLATVAERVECSDVSCTNTSDTPSGISLNGGLD